VRETARDGIRPTVRFIDDDSCDIESVRMVVRTRQRATHTAEVVDTQGGSRKPMSDADLTDKLAMLAGYSGFAGDVAALANAVWSLDTASDAGAIMRICTVRR
jgi:hypothetical protein